MKIRPDPATKPYYRCLSCPRFRKTCGGIPTRDMDLQNWCEYMRDVSDVFHLTNAYIAKEADVSIKTVDRVMAINCEQDIMRSTARRMELVVLGPVARHICDLDFEAIDATERIAKLEAELASAKEDVAYWRKENDRKAKIIDTYLGN
jgi:hypothetical protein